MKRFLLALGLVFAPLLATPAFGQAVTATLPVTCPPSGVNCVQSTPVVNPDGTTVGGGGTYTGPAASQLPTTLGAKTGAASLSVVPNTDTAFPISAASLPLPTGAATSALQTTMISNQTATGTSAQNTQGGAAAGTTTAVNPMITGCFARSTAQTVVTTTQWQRDWCFLNGQKAVTIVDSIGAETSITSGADNANNATNGLLGYSRMNVFTGTSWYRMLGDINGTVTQPYALTASRWSYAAASGGISNTTTAVTVKAAAGGSLINYVTGIQCMSGTLGAATEVAYRDGAGGTVLWRGYISTAGGMISFSAGSPLKGTANTLGEIVTLTATVTGAVYCNVQGYTAL